MKIEISIRATTKEEVEKVEALVADLKKLAAENPKIRVEVKRSS